MFCPKCGAENSTEQKFCRACGLNVEKSAASLIEQQPIDIERTALSKQIKLVEKLGSVGLIGLGIVALLGVLMLVSTIITKLILTSNNILLGIFFLALIIFAVPSLVYVIYNEYVKDKKNITNPVLANEEISRNELRKADTAKLLEDKPFEPIPSVTEDSTELLLIETKTQKFK